jgi:predicted  nucleic acid-binding Zn-ribbon protein
MLADLEWIVKMQGLDLRANGLRKEIALLPKQIAEIEKALLAHTRKLEADRALLASNQRERKQKDLEIQTQQAKIAKLRDQMTSAKTNEQYRAFQNEIDFCEKEIRKSEDRIVELMELSEPLAVNVKKAEEELAKEKAVVDRQKAAARERTAVDQKALDEITTERQGIAANITKPVLSTFERLSKKFSGNAVSDGTKGRCSACHLEIRPQLFQDLRRGDKLFVCENCGRILFYNPPVAVDAEAGGPVTFATGGTRVDMT